jgi:hypothetical protein
MTLANYGGPCHAVHQIVQLLNNPYGSNIFMGTFLSYTCVIYVLLARAHISHQHKPGGKLLFVNFYSAFCKEEQITVSEVNYAKHYSLQTEARDVIRRYRKHLFKFKYFLIRILAHYVIYQFVSQFS